MQLELSAIRTDGGTQPRATYHYGMVDAYAEDMDAGAALPPVVVFYDGTNYWLADGFHRVLAAKKIDRTEIDAEIHQGTLEDAQWYSYSVNQTHGLRRSNDDKRQAVEAAIKHPKATGMTDQEIADHCGVSQPMVNNYRNPKPTRNQETYKDNKSTENGYRKGKDGVKRKTPTKKPAPPTPTPAPEPEPEDDEPHQNGVTAPISEPASVGEEQLVCMADDLVRRLNYNDLCRFLEILSDRVAVEA